MPKLGLIDVRADVKELTTYLTAQEKTQIPFAVASALKRTAFHVALDKMPDETKRVFDRPTRWTQRAFFATPRRPNKRKLEASIEMKQDLARAGFGVPQFKFLKPEIEGGKRGPKGIELKLRFLGILGTNEYIVPGEDMPLDQFGNLRPSVYSKILADVQGEEQGISTGFGQATTRRGRKKFFYSSNLKPRGIWQRFGRGGRDYRVALLFVNKAPTYRPRFDFDGFARKESIKRFRREFPIAIRRAIRTAR